MQENLTNIYPIFKKMLSRKERETATKQQAKVLWMTGFSGAGKSTIGVNLERKLYEKGFIVQLLDRDNTRAGINKNSGFSDADDMEDISRIAEVAKLYLNSGIITICAFVSPTNEIRDLAKQIIGEDDFLEIFVATPIEVCEQRDVKGLYKKARAGEKKDFAGITGPWEPPTNPFVIVHTQKMTVQESVDFVLDAVLPELQKDQIDQIKADHVQ